MKPQAKSSTGLNVIEALHRIDVRHIVCLAFALLGVVLFHGFTAQAQVLATVIAPANGATNVDPGAAISWNAVSDAQAYYVYVGTAVGQSNIYNSGSISTTITSITPTGLQTNTLYYLRLWTEINGSWGSHYVDTTFTTGYGTAHLSNPLNGATNTDPFAPLTWNSAPTATSYTLNVGSSPGAADVFNSGPVTATSITVPGLQINTKYYATLYTQFSSGTQSSASTFTTGTGLAHLITPANGATNVVPGSTFTWNSVSNVQAYYLYIGTSVGLQNVYGSNAITATSVTPSNLALNTLYYARMWTEKNNVWSFVDSTFTTGSSGTITAAQLTSPANGATNVDPLAPFTWTTVANAQSYTLWVGTSAGSSNVYNSGPLTVTSQTVPGLQSNTKYFARLFTQTSGGTVFSDSSFTTGLALAHLTYPAANATNVDPFQVFTWNAVSGASGYYLYVGATPGATDILNSGQLPATTTSYMVFGLLGGSTYYPTLWSFINNVWYKVPSSFSTAPQPLPSDASAFRSNVQQQTGNVRLMTQGTTNTPIAGTLLAQVTAGDGRNTALCTEYAKTLAQLLYGQRTTARLRAIVFDSNETHVTVEYWDPFLSHWFTADPTFGIVYWNNNTTTGMAVNDISAAAVARNWSSIPVLYVTGNGEIYAHNYYMDPILLYLNPLPLGQNAITQPQTNSPASYMTSHTTADVGTPGLWVFGFVNSTDSVTIKNGGGGSITLKPGIMTPYSPDTSLRSGWSITSAPSGLQILTINRYLYF